MAKPRIGCVPLDKMDARTQAGMDRCPPENKNRNEIIGAKSKSVRAQQICAERRTR